MGATAQPADRLGAVSDTSEEPDREPPTWGGSGLGIGIAVGVGIGAAISSVTDDASWVAIGAGVGVAIGVALSSSRRRPDASPKE